MYRDLSHNQKIENRGKPNADQDEQRWIEPNQTEDRIKPTFPKKVADEIKKAYIQKQHQDMT